MITATCTLEATAPKVVLEELEGIACRLRPSGRESSLPRGDAEGLVEARLEVVTSSQEHRAQTQGIA